MPVICKCEQGGNGNEIAGFSRNISTTGVFVMGCASTPAQGTAVEVEVLLPPFNAHSQPIQLKSLGRVVWGTAGGGRPGFAVACPFGISEDQIGQVS